MSYKTHQIHALPISLMPRGIHTMDHYKCCSKQTTVGMLLCQHMNLTKPHH